MHSFQPSRGRIGFEVACALAMAASCAGAWMQTGASALLGAAAVTLLYGVIHLFDMRRTSEATPESQPILSEAAPTIEMPVVAFEPQPTVEAEPEAAEKQEPAVSRSGSGRRKGGSRKGNGRRSKASAEAKVVELVPQEVEAPSPVELPVADASPYGESSHCPVAPLFEPEPFVRQQRVMFGRKSR